MCALAPHDKQEGAMPVAGARAMPPANQPPSKQDVHNYLSIIIIIIWNVTQLSSTGERTLDGVVQQSPAMTKSQADVNGHRPMTVSQNSLF